MAESRTSQDLDERFMRRALALAWRGAGRTARNPMVGCVIVKDGAVIGEGFHEGPGLAHAEVAALAAAGEGARDATAYVSLEPCNHHGKTPPCTDALLAAGVGEVVFALDDPNHIASGGGARLRAAGVKVRSGVCEMQARDLNRAWLHAVKHRRPYVIAKAAMSLDGRIATRGGDSQWITGVLAREKGHELRRQADAVVVGAGTVIADDPALTARLDGATHYPLRVVLDSRGRTPPGAKVFERSGRGALLAATPAAANPRLAEYARLGVETQVLPANDDGRVDLVELLSALQDRNATTVMVEGGGEVLGAFLDADLIDEAWLFLAPLLIGGGRPAFNGSGPDRLGDAVRFDFAAPEFLGSDLFLRGRRRREAF